jgi:peptide/nickel transport system permease protein
MTLPTPSREPETAPETEFSDAEVAALVEAAPPGVAGHSPWLLAWRRLRRNRVALAAFAVFAVVCICCGLAGVYARDVAGRGPNDVNLGGTVVEHGRRIHVVSQGGITFANGQAKLRPAGVPIGPQWFSAGGRYFLGADTLGRDVAVRMLYGGRNSLIVGIGSALLCTAAAVVLALVAAYYRGWIDWLISRFFDLIWAFPVILLGIALGTALSVNGLHWGPIQLASGSLWIPTVVISYVLIPYIGRPLRGQMLSLREKEYVEASIAQGAGAARIMFFELLPNVASTVLVFFTLIVANNILIEAALSFLGAGVQPPNPSWGNLIADGQQRIQTAPWLAIVPGVAIVVTAVALNIFGDGLRDALDPRAKVRVSR